MSGNLKDNDVSCGIPVDLLAKILTHRCEIARAENIPPVDCDFEIHIYPIETNEFRAVRAAWTDFGLHGFDDRVIEGSSNHRKGK